MRRRFCQSCRAPLTVPVRRPPTNAEDPGGRCDGSLGGLGGLVRTANSLDLDGYVTGQEALDGLFLKLAAEEGDPAGIRWPARRTC